MTARDAAAEASVQAHHVGGNLVRSLRQRWNPSRPHQEPARCERLVDDKMLSRQSPEDARPTKTKIPEGASIRLHPRSDDGLGERDRPPQASRDKLLAKGSLPDSRFRLG